MLPKMLPLYEHSGHLFEYLAKFTDRVNYSISPSSYLTLILFNFQIRRDHCELELRIKFGHQCPVLKFINVVIN